MRTPLTTRSAGIGIDRMRTEQGTDLRCEGCGKVCYTAEEAGRILNIARKRASRFSNRPDKTAYRRHKGKIVKRKYMCRFCGYWHLTSKAHYTEKKR